MGRLTELIKSLQKVVKDLDLSVNDSVIFEQACSYHRGELIDKNMNNRFTINKPIQAKSNEPKQGIDSILKATDKQRLALIKMGFSGDLDKVSKKEAWKIINERKGGKS